MKRNSSIDYFKFIFSIIIVLFHYGLYMHGGYIVVEGFFMITGFLMMTSLKKRGADGELPADSTAKFVLHKYAIIFLPLLFSAISGFLIYEILIYQHTYDLMLKDLPLLLFEVFPLQMAGFSGMWTTGVSWYMSAMLIAIAILHPFAQKAPERFGYTVAPVLALLSYGLLCMHYGRLDVPNLWIVELVNSGLVRAIAGICGGCVLFCLVSRAKEKVGVGMRMACTVAELWGWWYLISMISDEERVKTHYDFVLVAVIFGILYMELSGKTLFSLLPGGKVSKALATCSTYIFMNHFAWNVYFDRKYPDRSPLSMLPWYALCVAVSSLFAWGMTVLTHELIKLIKTKRNSAPQS